MDSTTTNESANRPVARIRFGGVSAAIWRNETEQGAFFNVTFQRTYRDGEDWKSTQSFGRDDLLVLAKLADVAHTKLHELYLEGEA